MRIAMLCTDFGTGGIARHTLDLAEWLRSRGHLVFLVGSEGEWANTSTHADFLSIPIRWAGGEGGALPRRLANVGRSALALRRLLKEQMIDLIHAHESAPGLVALVARAGLSIPIVITYHGSEPQRIKSFGSIARRADRVVSPSFRSADDLVSIGGVAHERIQVIGLGIRPPPRVNEDKAAALRSNLLGSDGTHLVVSIARVAHQKGIDILIDCAERMVRRNSGFRFAIVGDGPLGPQMRAYAKEKNVEDHVHFVGRSEHPFRYLHAADLMLLTSRWEALPISIVEAFQTATPVVATDCSGVGQLVDEQVGACVPIGDVGSISDAVQRILLDRDLRKRMGQAAKLRSLEDRFNPRFINEQFEALYRSLARGDTS